MRQCGPHPHTCLFGACVGVHISVCVCVAVSLSLRQHIGTTYSSSGELFMLQTLWSARTPAWVQQAGRQRPKATDSNMPGPTEEHHIPLWIQQTGVLAKDWRKGQSCSVAAADKTTHPEYWMSHKLRKEQTTGYHKYTVSAQFTQLMFQDLGLFPATEPNMGFIILQENLE